MNQWFYVADVAQINAEQLLTFCVQGEELLVYRTGDNYHIYPNRCPHQAVPLASGYLVRGAIVCRLHGAKFDLQTGRCLRSPAYEDLRTYPCEVRNGQLYVDLSCVVSYNQRADQPIHESKTFDP